MTRPDEQAAPYRIWRGLTAFRKNGTPVLGNMGSSIRSVIIIEGATWNRLIAEVPQLAATLFEVGDL